jgi:hypothetical protein
MGRGCRVEVVEGDEGPMVLKTATTVEGAERLRREADRLERAAHPGVVALVERRDDPEPSLVLAWAGARTLETARPPTATAAALLASVAATVADLHGLGIVHGRLDPSHVVLGRDGRPRICGLAGPEPGDHEPGPADDVAALGALIDAVVGDADDLEPIPDSRWARRPWSGYDRRALLTLADQATDPDEARRPTARTLAQSLADAVPEPRRRPTTSRRARRRTRRGRPVPPTVPDADATAEPQPTTPPDGAGSPALPPAPGVPDRSSATSEPMQRAPLGDAPPPDATADESMAAVPPEATDRSIESSGPTPHGRSDDRPEPIEDATAEPSEPGERFEPGNVAPDVAGTMLKPDTVEASLPLEPVDHHPATVLGLRIDRAEPGPEPGRHGLAGEPAVSPVDRLRGPADPSVADVRASLAERSRTVLPQGRGRLALVALVVTVLAVAGRRLVLPGADRPGPSAAGSIASPSPVPSASSAPPASAPPATTPSSDRAPTPTAPATTRPSPTMPATSTIRRPPVRSEPTRTRPTGTAPAAPGPEPACRAPGTATPDVDRDGCGDVVRVSGSTVEVGGARYAVGRDGDRVAVGDWDCDGQPTPGLVRPATGEVFVFDGWATGGGEVTVHAVATVLGARSLVPPAPADPCPGPSVRLADGRIVPLGPAAGRGQR